MLRIVFALILGVFPRLSESHKKEIPLRWKNWEKDLSADCSLCLIKRNYTCDRTTALCEEGNFEEKVYKTAFKNHCFGMNALNDETVKEFLSLVKSGKNDWRVPLKKLMNVIHGTGLWEERYFTLRACELLSLKPMPRKIRAIARTTSEEVVQAGEYNRRLMKRRENSRRFYASTQYRCPINQSIVWREKFRYCDSRDTIKERTSCICVENNGAIAEKTLCLNDSGFEDTRCPEGRTPNPCDCPTISTTMEIPRVLSMPRSKQPLTSSIFTTHHSIWTTATTQSVTSVTGNRSTTSILIIVVIVLCICIVALLLTILVCRIWNNLSKDSRSTPQDWNILQRPNKVTIEPSELSRPTPQVMDTNYFCVGDEPNQDLYQTIDNTASSAPPLPFRLFSVSSTNTVKSSRAPSTLHVSNLPSVSAVVYRCDEQDDDRDGVYASIGRRQDERTYDLPPLPEVFIDNKENQKSFCRASLPSRVKSDVRINPLYACEDEMYVQNVLYQQE